MKIIFFSSNKNFRKIIYIIASGVLLFSAVYSLFSYRASPVSVTKDQLNQDFKQMFIIRDKAALSGDTESVKNLFDTSTKLGRWAYEHERKRTEYLKNWTIIRKTKFTQMESDFRIQRIRDKGSSIWVDFIHSGKFTYIYPDMPDQPVSFGIGTRRSIEVAKKDNGWIIKREWYLDPFEDILEVPEELKNEVPKDSSIGSAPPEVADDNLFELEVEPVAVQKKLKYNREKAVTYADKYSGATYGSGNDYKYNRKYRDFTGLGGDCSNFISQALGDKSEGGGLKMDGTWHYAFGYRGVGGGTMAWVRAISLKNYLLYSGKAQLIKKGALEQVSEPFSAHPQGAYKMLQKGDLVAYQDKYEVDHFSMVTAFDPKGLPLVNSHTTDRYKVPWDLGWSGKKIKYWLLHIRD
jgi:hypothetical protein